MIMGERQGCVLPYLLLRTYMDWIFVTSVHQSNCGAFTANSTVTDFIFANDAFISVDALELLVLVLELLHEEKLQVSWVKTKV